MNRKVLLLSESFTRIKEVNLQLSSTVSRELVEDPLKSIDQRSGRWKIRSAYGDIGLRYREDETIAYVASRMPAVYSACYRVLKEVHFSLSLLFLVPFVFPLGIFDDDSGGLGSAEASWFQSLEGFGFWCGAWFGTLVRIVLGLSSRNFVLMGSLTFVILIC